MKCEAEYCIYNRNWECIYESIQLNSLGMCEEYIFVSLDKDFLEVEKERQARKIEEQARKGT